LRRIFNAKHLHIKSHSDKTEENHIDIKNYRLISREKTSQSRKIITQSINQRNALRTFALLKRVVTVTITKDITKETFINVRFATNDFIIVHDIKSFVNVAFIIRKLIIVDVFFNLIRSVKIINNIKNIIRIIIVSFLLLRHDEKRARFTLDA
jgi:hypothetical protein